MKAICINCRYAGAITSKEGLVCSQTKNFKSVKTNDTCDNYIQGACENCGSDDIGLYKSNPDYKPHIIRIEYSCNSCKNFWYQDI